MLTHARMPRQEYLGITGNPRFNELSAKLAFGERSRVLAEGRNATVQALSGTGALRVRSQPCPCSRVLCACTQGLEGMPSTS